MRDVDEINNKPSLSAWLVSCVELPGIQTDSLPGEMLSELQFHYVSVRFSPARYLRSGSRVLTASRAVNHFSTQEHAPFELVVGTQIPAP